MATTHGVNVTQQATSLSTPSTAAVGIPFVIGTAPLTGDATAKAGTPVLATSYAEAEAALGYDDNWATYTLCEFMYCHFKLYNCQPVIFLPLASSSDKAAVAAAVEKIELCMPMLGIVPDLILAPGFSHESTVAAAMAAKATAINGMFEAKALVDITAASYTAAITAKTGGSFTKQEIVCWPMVKLGDKTFHMSSVIAGRMAATDSDNGGIPYESPSNKSVQADSLVDGNGNAIILTHSQANALNAAGIVTALNFMGGFVAWGNCTGAYPTNTDIKDNDIATSRMFGWVGNTLIKTFWSKLDKPMTRRLIDSILDAANIWLNGLVGSGYLLGARVEMRDSENSLTNLMSGIIKLHVYMTPAGPAQEIDFVLEYDADYVSEALSTT